MADAPLAPALIDRIRERASDSRRRNDADSMQLQTVGLDSMFDHLGPRGAKMRSIMTQITDLMGSSAPKPNNLRMTTSSPIKDPSREKFDPLPQVAQEADFSECEKAIGRTLPHALRQLYSEVGDGRFGPGAGLFELRRIADVYREMTDEPAGPQNQPWPPNLLPLVDAEPGYDCLDIDSGAMVGWDPGEVEGYSDAGWQRSFRPLAPSLGAWLEGWLGRPSPGDLMTAVREKDRREAKAGALQAILDFYEKNPKERVNDGLPEVGWEDEVRRRHPGLGS